MTEITILNNKGVFLEKIKIKEPPVKYIIHRGRLLVADQRLVFGNKYIEQPYLELY